MKKRSINRLKIIVNYLQESCLKYLQAAGNILKKIDINDTVFIVFIALIAYKYIFHIESIIDILAWDETFAHLRPGIHLLQDWPLAPDWAPLYQIWYFILNQFIGDPAILLYFNIKILFFLVSLTLYIYLRRIAVYPFIAFIAAVLFMATGKDANFWLLSFSSSFGLVVLLSMLIRSTFLRRLDIIYLNLTLGFMLLSYIRPEYFISFLLFLLIFFIYFLKVWLSKKKSPSYLSSYLPYWLTMLIIYYYLGSPVGEGGRFWMAVKDNFAASYIRRHHMPVDIYVNDNIEKIFSSVFGSADNLVAAALANFPEWIIHFIGNFNLFIIQMFNSFVIYFPPKAFVTVWLANRNYSVLLLIFFFLLPYIIIERQKISKLLKSETYHVWAIMFAGVLISTCYAAILFAPQVRYLIFLKMALVVLLAMMISLIIPKKFARSAQHIKITIMIGISFFVFTPSVVYGPLPIFKAQEDKSGVPCITAVNYLKSLKIKDKATLYINNANVAVYMPKNISALHPWQKDVPLLQYISNNKINMILVFQYDNFLNDKDPQAKYFLDHYEDLGFQKRVIPGTETRVYIKNDLLKEK